MNRPVAHSVSISALLLQLPPPRRPGSAPGGGRGAGTRGKPESQAAAGGNKKRPRDGSRKDEVGSSEAETVGDSENAARVYQEWLEARYLDFMKVLLSWVAEVGDFHRQVRTSVGRGIETVAVHRREFVDLLARIRVVALKRVTWLGENAQPTTGLPAPSRFKVGVLSRLGRPCTSSREARLDSCSRF